MEKDNTVLVLKTVNADMSDRYHSFFIYPRQGMVSCPDLDSGSVFVFHGLLRGTGDGSNLSWEPDAVWLVLRVSTDDITDYGYAVDFSRGEVIFAGDRKTATDMLKAAYPDAPVVGCTTTVESDGIAITGDYGIATAGNRSKAIAGDHGIAIAAEDGSATVGDCGSATVSDYGIATAGYRGTADAGKYGIAIAGDQGTAIVGDHGVASSGVDGIANAGENGEIRIRWFDLENKRYRTAIGYPGENGILPNVFYHVVKGKLIRKE